MKMMTVIIKKSTLIIEIYKEGNITCYIESSMKNRAEYTKR